MSKYNRRFNPKLVNEMLERGYDHLGLLHVNITNTDLEGFLAMQDMREVLVNIENGDDITQCAS